MIYFFSRFSLERVSFTAFFLYILSSLSKHFIPADTVLFMRESLANKNFPITVYMQYLFFALYRLGPDLVSSILLGKYSL